MSHILQALDPTRPFQTNGAAIMTVYVAIYVSRRAIEWLWKRIRRPASGGTSPLTD